VEDLFENVLRGGSNPEWMASLRILLVPALWNSSDKNGVTGPQNSYSGVIAALKVLL